METYLTNDGSFTLYSKEFSQHYHNVKDGALHESLSKHVIPSYEFVKDFKQVHILDICFGIGYNTLATLYYYSMMQTNKKIFIYSPEFNLDLLQSLVQFPYPKEFEKYHNIVSALSNNFFYEDQALTIQIYNGDAREYLDILARKKVKIDIVYQDAFSSNVNRSLWTKEYFAQIYKLLGKKSVITTYSIATSVRLSMYENSLKIYEVVQNNTNKSTIATVESLEDSKYKFIDMELKKQRNPSATPLYD